MAKKTKGKGSERKGTQRKETKRGGRRNSAAASSAPAKSGATRAMQPARATTARRNGREVKGEHIGAMLLSGAGVALVEHYTDQATGGETGVVSILAKGGIGYLLAEHGNKVPLVGRYAAPIGHGLMFLAVYQGIKSLALPHAAPYLPSIPAFFTASPQAPAPGAGVAGLSGWTGVPGGMTAQDYSGYPSAM